MGLGWIRVELTAGDCAGVLSKVAQQGITVHRIQKVDELTVMFTVDRRCLRTLKALCQSAGGSLRLVHSAGFAKTVKRALSRPVLLLGILLLLGLTLYLPSRIIVIEVQGAQSLATEEILWQAAQCGLGFGASRKDIRSEQMKNALLERLPQLQWVGINTYGCRAVISVRPRTIAEVSPEAPEVSSLVAIRDGFVTEMTVLAGNPLCKVGSMVQKGQVLISGYSDLGICIQGTAAKGEVYAQTIRSVEVQTPSEKALRRSKTAETKKYSLIIGKNRINFFKGSGISGTSCDKMYSYHYITLPGGYRLPVALVVEAQEWYEEEASTIDEEMSKHQLSSDADAYLRSQMIAGQIIQRYEIVTSMDGGYYQIGKYVCCELISRSRPEEDLGTNEVD